MTMTLDEWQKRRDARMKNEEARIRLIGEADNKVTDKLLAEIAVRLFMIEISLEDLVSAVENK